MITLQQQEIIDALVAANWPLPLATRFATHFPALDEIFAPVVHRWRMDGSVSDVVLFDCSLVHMMQVRQEHLLVCIRNMHMIYSDLTLTDTQKQHFLQQLCKSPIIE